MNKFDNCYWCRGEGKVVDGKLILKIGRPIKTSSLNYEDRNIFAEDVRNEVVKLVKD